MQTSITCSHGNHCHDSIGVVMELVEAITCWRHHANVLLLIWSCYILGVEITLWERFLRGNTHHGEKWSNSCLSLLWKFSFNCIFPPWKFPFNLVNGLVQGRHNSSVLEKELCLSCINPSIFSRFENFHSQNDDLYINTGFWICFLKWRKKKDYFSTATALSHLLHFV